MRTWVLLAFVLQIAVAARVDAQSRVNLKFTGQASAVGSWSPNNTLDLFGGARYIPNLNLGVPLKEGRALDFEAAANFSGSLLGHPFDTLSANGDISPYRLWGRYTGKQFELRAGLQKIDFGSSTLLRPLQWFNQIDPRDPLQLTNGVYGVLTKYYFANNANIWLWGLYGNPKQRGYDLTETYDKHPEFGGRFQYPTPNGEIALSYHHRTADSRNLLGPTARQIIPEDRFGLDGKWDLTVGLWFEATHVLKSRNMGLFTNQTLLNLGLDYTFGIGNGLHVVGEHLLSAADQNAFQFSNTAHVSAASASYPLGLWDTLSGMAYYSWSTETVTFFLNYEHQFKRITGYLMAYYNPDSQQGIIQNELVNQFSGPGIRLMLVYNH